MEARWSSINKLRRIDSIEYWQLPDAPCPLTFAQEPKLSICEKELSEDPTHWQRKQKGECREWKPLENEVWDAAETQLSIAGAAARPVKRTFTLRKLSSQ